jgi:YegS/Rv2252/BmrU family lipid kinase
MLLSEKWFVIVNPKAGNGKGAKKWPKIQQTFLKMGIEYDFAISQTAGHSITLAKEAVEKGYRKLAAVGGDGTAHEVVNGLLLQQLVPSQELTFAIIPVGTGNDWIRTHEIPRNYKKAILLLAAGNTKRHDVGKINYHSLDGEPLERYFINIAGLAYDAFVTKATQAKRPFWGKGQLYYLYLILKCMTSFRPTPITIAFDNEKTTHHFYNITIGQCRYNGGGTQLVPHAIPDDGLFALTLFKDIRPIDLIINTIKLYNGSIIHHREAVHTQCKQLTLTTPSDQPAYIEADGEWLGQTPVKIDMLPQAIRIITL